MINEEMTCAVGLALRFFREEWGLTQSAVALRLGVQRPAVTLMESGRQGIPFGLALAWCALLDIATVKLIDRAYAIVRSRIGLGAPELQPGPLPVEFARQLARLSMERGA